MTTPPPSTPAATTRATTPSSTPSSTPMEIPVPDEGFTLRGLLDGPPDGSPVVLCHPHPAFGGTMHTPVIVAVAEALAGAGMRVLRFNFRGIGGSGGRPEGGLAEHKDVLAAAAYLRAATGRPIALAGYSFGALMASRAIATSTSTTDGDQRITRFACIAIPTAIIRGHDERIGHVRAAIRAQPTLLIAGTNDQFCDWRELRTWSDGAATATLVPLDGVSHFPTGPALADLTHRVAEFLAG